MKILVMVDMQNDFISGALGTPEARAIVPYVREKIVSAREKGCEIFCTMDTHGADYLSTSEGKKLPVPHCIRGTEGWELPGELSEVIADISPSRRILKNSFGAKELPAAIADICGIPDEIELIGVCTDICVISNAMLLKAFFPEAEITVDGKCCAGTSPEAHERALAAMEMCQINVV